MTVYDISWPISNSMPGFPGDPPVNVVPTRLLARGDAYSVSSVSLSSHTGTHVDPPAHFLLGGPTVDQIDPLRWNGRCHVVEVPNDAPSIGVLEVEAAPVGATRLLFRTANSARWARSPEFFPDYVGVNAEGATALLARGTRLVGIDSLSVERDATGRYPVHHRLLAGDCLILEGLRLEEVSAGPYELRCLPLRLKDGDGAPARAVLEGP